jgi:hypothetical protein
MLIKKAIFAVMGIAVLGVAGTASAGPSSESWQVRGNGANASGYGGDGCTYWGLDVSANDEVVHQGHGAPVARNSAWLGYWSYDWCTGREVSGWVYQDNANFTGNLSEASISATFDVYLYEWQLTSDGYWEYVIVGTDTVNVSVGWTGAGETVSGMEHWTYRWGQDFSRSRWLGRVREANVAMSATLGGANVPFDVIYGNLGRYSTGNTTMYHY